ncbi:MAG TPA: 23S rRNA (uracil(1939)-C(5))-methyltransferase RlmD [Bacteroidales bacterium]|nr:23S rRNA (uracil(1939)-C(5))-methyltransferase RlmD [Bacteroidales bacterium]HNR43132.1 23S rRNA (uracil(1939)-C(5))-methyltransferase RlmD [Bacteroidales bacterium]HPM19169.1 23S rRNA (uracil(1939)-C(5))-methyltransferase RlmD [Bacteroidales bacterium]
MGRKKEYPIFGNVRITDIGAEGNALARVNNMVVFVPMLIPGDVVDIQVVRKRKNYLEGRVLRFREYSPDRVEPVCIHFGICGGCRWQHLPYELQLHYKQKQVADNLERIGKINVTDISRIAGSADQFRYRNKLEFTFSDKRWLTREEIASDNEFAGEDAIGFHIPGLFDKVLDIRECHLQPEPSNLIRNSVREYAHRDRMTFFNKKEQTGFLRNMIVRNNQEGDVMVIMVFFYEDPERRKGLLDHLVAAFPEISSLFYVVNPKKNDSLNGLKPVLYKGEDHLAERMEGLKFRIGPISFYQTNSRQALQLYKIARDFAGLRGTETVYDLYTGTGTIACFVAGQSGRVIGIDNVGEAVQDARYNAANNNLGNVSFFMGDIKSLLTEQFFAENGRPDIVITDPPRAGMDKKVINAIIDAEPEKIVYISCNPSTQARDIQIMNMKYQVVRIQPVDMFPQTHHVENVVLLRKV